jgi:DNA-directed RNA polymerase specialized sigma24 family protein
VSQDLQSQLLQECIDGNRQAQQMLYERYAHRFLNIAYRVVWHKEDARDVVQESFMKIFSSLRGLKETVKFEGWAKRIVVNKALSELAPGYRTIISLYLLEGYDHKEISEIMGISVSTSITQFNRGKKRLKEKVKFAINER